MPSAIATGVFSSELQPFVKGKKRFIECKCPGRGRIFKEGWSINGRNCNRTRREFQFMITRNLLTPTQATSEWVGKLQSRDMVNLQDVDDGRKRKRFEARIEQRSLTTSETECIENSNCNLQKRNRTGGS